MAEAERRPSATIPTGQTQAERNDTQRHDAQAARPAGGGLEITGSSRKANLPGRRCERMESSMTATEAARLIDWLIAHGHTAEDATECIKYIAGTLQPTAK